MLRDVTKAGRTHITFQWVPGHCDLEGNEEADASAKGAILLCHRSPIDLMTAEALISRNVHTSYRLSLTDPASVHVMDREPPNPRLESNLTKRERQIISQLRTGGSSPILRKYLHRIGKAESPTCLHCNEEDDSLEHALLQCPAMHMQRLHHLGIQPTLTILKTNPEAVIDFLRGTGRVAQ